MEESSGPGVFGGSFSELAIYSSDAMTELEGIVTVSVYRRRSCIMTCVSAPLNLPWFQSPVNSVDSRYPSNQLLGSAT